MPEGNELLFPFQFHIETIQGFYLFVVSANIDQQLMCNEK